MARPLRIQYPDAWYHVMNRGRSKTQIFYSQADYSAFIELLKDASFLWKVRIAAYCLMSNHYHLLIQTPEANLSRCMRHINGLYTQYFNRTHKSDGQLFRGRYKSIVIERDSYLLELMRYIHRNPLHAGLVKHLEDYLWSSHRAYLSKAPKDDWLHKDFVLAMLDENKSGRRQAYIDFISQEEPETIKAIYEKSKLPLLLGAKDFINDIRQKYYGNVTIKEIPRAKELLHDKSRIEKAVSRIYQIEVAELLKSRRGNYNEARNVAIYLMRKYAGLSLNDIGSHFGMSSYSGVSSVIGRIKQAMDKNKKLRQRVTATEKLLI